MTQADKGGRPSDAWSAERIEELRRLSAEGLGNKRIARVMGLTIGQVSGKRDRLGLMVTAAKGLKRNDVIGGARTKRAKLPRGVDGSTAAKVVRAARRKQGKLAGGSPVPVPPTPPAEIDDEGARHLTLMDLKPADCRFPFGEQLPYSFCDRRSLDGLSWCGVHARIVYQPLALRQQLRRVGA